MFALKYTYYQ